MTEQQQAIKHALQALEVENLSKNGDLDACIADLLADLMHLCQHRRLNFEALLSKADGYVRSCG